MFRDGAPGQPPHLAFVGNSDTAAQIELAESPDGLQWTVKDDAWMTGRPGCWDSAGVAPGPQPERLSTGDYLMLYKCVLCDAGCDGMTVQGRRCKADGARPAVQGLLV